VDFSYVSSIRLFGQSHSVYDCCTGKIVCNVAAITITFIFRIAFGFVILGTHLGGGQNVDKPARSKRSPLGHVRVLKSSCCSRSLVGAVTAVTPSACPEWLRGF